MAEQDPDGATARLDRALLNRLRHALGALETIDAPVMRRARWLQTRALVAVGNEALLLEFDRGRLAVRDRWPPLTAWDFAVRGTARAWTEYWRPVPAPGWHDLLALSKRRELSLEGDLYPFMTHLEFFKTLLALPRSGAGS